MFVMHGDGATVTQQTVSTLTNFTLSCLIKMDSDFNKRSAGIQMCLKKKRGKIDAKHLLA
jgi:hypothetical protein